jgi:uncharacterized damage-inducible protein DinB
MDELAVLRFWYRYNSARRTAYLDAIARLPPRIYRKNEGASYPLLQIYLHVLDAYRWWFRYVYRDEVRKYPSERLRTRLRTLAEARRATTQVTKEVQRFMERLTPRDLDRQVVYSVPADDEWTRWQQERVSLRAMLWHMVEEELQHRGEMNALLWRHGIEPPIVGFDDWSGGKTALPRK